MVNSLHATEKIGVQVEMDASFRITASSCEGAHALFTTLSRRGLNQIKLAYSPSLPDNGLGQYVSSPGNRAYCYAELAASSLAMAVIIASTHFAYPWRDGQAELAWVAGYIQRWSTRFEDGHLSKY